MRFRVIFFTTVYFVYATSPPPIFVAGHREPFTHRWWTIGFFTLNLVFRTGMQNRKTVDNQCAFESYDDSYYRFYCSQTDGNRTTRPNGRRVWSYMTTRVRFNSVYQLFSDAARCNESNGISIIFRASNNFVIINTSQKREITAKLKRKYPSRFIFGIYVWKHRHVLRPLHHLTVNR